MCKKVNTVKIAAMHRRRPQRVTSDLVAEAAGRLLYTK
jgi:hypothetical protein